MLNTKPLSLTLHNERKDNLSYLSSLYDFNDKLYLITGGTSGIGLATAEELIRLGARVIITGRNREKLNALSNRFGSWITPLDIDSSSPESGNELAQAVEQHGMLDGLWLNAAIAELDGLQHVNAENYSKIMDINIRGPLLQLASLSAYLKDNASVIVTSSSSVYEGAKLTSLYTASKGALSAVIRVWSNELAHRGIRVNSLALGPVVTNLRRFLSIEEQVEFEKSIVEQLPLGRAASAHEIANVAIFLFSSASSYITGSEIPVDGGLIKR
ncbi:SDR family oxidoreductase [Vibrio sp. Of14-4]|uniref:SDR family oxidoreductase n=1 Tax=Vibrio sp. Of14-4 TaxID=2724878 RepID=UPI001EF1A9DC|nr:SDR family oxidoreductase [Vibrio sp. Of14-4]MCG7490999.1 SDR family oxidoreductase [Vibrio sp. Of14-4]